MATFSEVPATIPATVLRRHVYDTPHKTAVVIGLPQGGTSMLAAVVDALGVPMTAGRLLNFEKEDDRPRFDDNFEAWTGKVEVRNGREDVWGFKDTLIWRFDAQAVQAVLRNPYYLVAIRDVAAIAQRRAANHALVEPDHVSRLAVQAAEESVALWQFMGELQSGPLLIVSYERALRAPFEACRLVNQFLGLEQHYERLHRAAARISPTGGYLVREDESNAA